MFASRRVPVWNLVWALLACLTITSAWRPASAQQPERTTRGLVSLATRPAQSIGERRDESALVTSMRRAGELRLRTSRADPILRGRTHERLDQYYRGVRVFGADVAQQLNGGQVVSLYGNVYDDITIDPSPAITAEQARASVEARTGVEIGREPELVVIPRDGTYTLAWRVRAATGEDVREYFLDAQTGAIAFDYSDLQTQSAVGRGTGVLGDAKKISVSPSGGQFVTTDRLRPPAINTYDMKGDYLRTIRYLNEVIQLTANDLGTDADNTWTDTALVDAHAYAGYTYDYYFKRHNRRGLDNNNLSIVSLVHPVRRQDFQQNFRIVPDFYLNAGYLGDGVMFYGEGLPAGVVLVGGQTVDFFSGAIDIVAHELTHGVTDYSSNLIYLNESGALNEAFSDIMGASVEFFFQPAGNGTGRADWLLGEDVIRPGGLRSMSNPLAFGDPDHYSQRYTGPDDNGGVHTNSGIANNAFHLAVEGGTNRTSGLSVQGVGASNRDQMERVFYRAFTQLLPANATFSVARAATIQAARDLFGANSNAERAVTQAWTAVGVN
jgi:bacillolysin